MGGRFGLSAARGLYYGYCQEPMDLSLVRDKIKRGDLPREDWEETSVITGGLRVPLVLRRLRCANDASRRGVRRLGSPRTGAWPKIRPTNGHGRTNTSRAISDGL